MFVLGIFSFFQIIFLPGIILLKLLKIKTDSIIQTFLYAFGFSLYFNYMLICLLAWLKIYTYKSIYILFLIEVVVFGYLLIKQKFNFSFVVEIKDYYLEFINFLKKLTTVHKIVFVSSCLIILFFISFIPVNSWSVISVFDAVARDKWVIDWASNNLPMYTGHYPQLIISNLSLFYVFIHGLAIQLFPKSIMPLFFIGILLIFLDLYLQKKSIIYLISLILYGIIIVCFYTLIFSGDCNLDIPVSFFGFLTFYTIIKHGINKFSTQGVLLAALFASVSSETKLAGMYIVTFTTVWIIYAVYKNRKEISKSKLIKMLIWILLIFLGNLFWYFIKPVDMYNGLSDWISMLSPNYFDRFLNAANMLLYSFGWLLSIYLLATLIFSLFVKEVRYIVLIMIIPPLFLWMFYYSYDYRNLSFSIPFMAYVSSFGLKYFYDNNPWMQKIVQNINSKNYFEKKYSKREKTFFSLTFIFLLAAFYLVISSNAFFNLGMKISYFLRIQYYMGYSTIYTTEFGYYKPVEYFIGALKILSIILFILFVLRKTRIKLYYIFGILLLLIVSLNFTLFTKENLVQRQNYDQQMVIPRNLYCRIYTYVVDFGIRGNVFTDYYQVFRLIPPEGIKFNYTPININTLPVLNHTADKAFYLLFDKNKIDKETSNYINGKIKSKEYKVQFDDGEFILLKAV